VSARIQAKREKYGDDHNRFSASKHSEVYSAYSVPQKELDHLKSTGSAPFDGKDSLCPSKPTKKSNHKTPSECLKIIRDMNAFDWTLKDISNLRHSPCKR